MNIPDTLRTVPLFSLLSAEDIAAIAQRGEERAAPEGEVLFRQGEAGDAFYVVLEGGVRLTSEGEGHELEIATIGAGQFFGEMSLLDDAPRSATATVSEDARLFRVSQQSCQELIARSPFMLRGLLHQLTAHLRRSNTHRIGLTQEREALRTRGELERLRALSQMVAGLAHEINTPLGIIRNASSLVSEILAPSALPSMAKDAEAAEALGDVAAACALIQKNLDHASRLVQSFKSLSVRQITDARETVDLPSLLAEVLDMYRLKARSSRLELRFSSSLEAEGRSWDGYPGHLSQVILNLVSNADRYAYPDGKGGAVEISLGPSPRRAGAPGFELVVKDRGRGITDADLPRIFEPFFTTGRDRDGTGLGLAIVHNIVTGALGGSIEVESAPGEGALFRLRFPREAPQGGAL